MNFSFNLSGAGLTGNVVPVTGNILGAMLGLVIVCALVGLLMIIALWIIFRKTGRHGYEALVPGHNLYELIVLAGRPGRRIFLLLVPYILLMLGAALFALTGSLALMMIVTVIMRILLILYFIDLNIQLGRRFKKSGGFIFGMIILPVIFYPILAFGKSAYTPKK